MSCVVEACSTCRAALGSLRQVYGENSGTVNGLDVTKEALRTAM
jgi:hypothetical protein